MKALGVMIVGRGEGVRRKVERIFASVGGIFGDVVVFCEGDRRWRGSLCLIVCGSSYQWVDYSR